MAVSERVLCIGRRVTSKNKVVDAYIELNEELAPEKGTLTSYIYWAKGPSFGVSRVPGSITIITDRKVDAAHRWHDEQNILEWQLEDQIAASKARALKKAAEQEEDLIAKTLAPIIKAMKSTDVAGARLMMAEVNRHLYRGLIK